LQRVRNFDSAVAGYITQPERGVQAIPRAIIDVTAASGAETPVKVHTVPVAIIDRLTAMRTINPIKAYTACADAIDIFTTNPTVTDYTLFPAAKFIAEQAITPIPVPPVGAPTEASAKGCVTKRTVNTTPSALGTTAAWTIAPLKARLMIADFDALTTEWAIVPAHALHPALIGRSTAMCTIIPLRPPTPSLAIGAAAVRANPAVFERDCSIRQRRAKLVYLFLSE